MNVAGLLHKWADGAKEDLDVCVFQALMADNAKELQEVAERVADSGSFPPDFVYDLEAFAGWRAHYAQAHLPLTPLQRTAIDAIDDEWTARLVRQMKQAA